LFQLFELEDTKKINPTIYQYQTLKGPLQKFSEESVGDAQEPIVVEDCASPHKKVCIPVR